MRIFAMVKAALFEARSIVFQKPHRHVARRRAAGALARQAVSGNGDDDVGKGRPGVVQVVLRRPRRMIRVRVIEAEQLGAELRRAPFGFAIIRGPD
jgi:hypothetical protein